MSGLKVTPGPWRIEDRRIAALKEKVVCEVPMHGIRQAKVDINNAHLIVAAPDLYAALGRVLKEMPVYAYKSLYDEIERVMAKARGEQP